MKHVLMSIRSKTAFFALAAWIASTGIEAIAADFPFFQPVQPSRHVQVIARTQGSEKPLAILERAIADSAEWVAIDVSAETLEETLGRARGRVNLVVEARQFDHKTLVRMLIDSKMTNQVVVSAPIEVLQAIRSVDGGETLALMVDWKPSIDLAMFDPGKFDAITVDAADLTPERCRAFHDRGLKVRVVGDRAELWDRAIAAGVDWIETDRPEEVLAREVLRRAGSHRVKVAHHRGASRYAPENTLPAYEKSIRLGADFVEFDIRTSRDGVPFLLHDATFNRTTDARGPIRERTADEVAHLDAGGKFARSFVGTPVPTLEAFLEAFGHRVELYVDAKDIAPQALVDALRSHGLIERSVVYQSADYLARLRAIEPRLRRMPPLGKPDQIDALADRLEPYAFDTRWSLLSKPLIDRCHARGVKVFSDALGANESVDRYRRAILDGIDLIQTDHPVRVLRAIELVGSQEISAEEGR